MALTCIRRKEIQSFMLRHLDERSLIQKEIRERILFLLHSPGKLFREHTRFCWGEFYTYIAKFHNHIQTEMVIPYAVAIEFLIVATDLFDDIADEEKNNALQEYMSTGEMIIIANTLFVEAINLIALYTSRNLREEIDRMIKELKKACNGQWRDLHFTIGTSVPTEEQYFQLISQKSSSLTRLVCQLGAGSAAYKWHEIATHIGISGQLRNDAKDILCDGKNDLICKKATLPLIKALEYSFMHDNGWLLNKLDCSNFPLHIHAIRNYIQKTGALDYCFILSDLYMKRAIKQIEICFPAKKEAIRELKTYLESS
ncbi:polyprenyl synthetase family protein [Anoxybacillus sp. D401a]|uniref:polyprenyl synthetase family protein n=1 Tax=Anoxybacillus sp. D401a TaxID=575112 RepID=UPI003D324BCF